jgi:hypothetical protein
LGLIAAPAAWANTWIVMTNAEIGASDPLDKNTCNAANSQCPTLREAITAAKSGDRIMFAPALDGQTITLTRYTDCLTPAQAKGTTCLPLNPWPTVPGSSPAVPYVSQFGASAFFISGKTIAIDATQTPDLLLPMKHGVVIARDPSAPNFRLFDIDGTNDGQGNLTSVLFLDGLTLKGGVAQGGDGGSGSAGGAFGAGGAIFNRGDLELYQTSFVGNAANGGSTGVSGSGSGGAGAGQSSDSSGNGGGPNGSASGAGGFGGGAAASGGGGGFGGGGAIGTGGFGAGGGVSANGGFGGGNGGTSGGGGGAGMGGAIFNDAGTIRLANCTLTANFASGGANRFGDGHGGSAYGGAIFNYNGSLKVNSVTLLGNGVTAGAATTAALAGKIAAGAIYSLGDSQAACSAGGNASCTTAGATLAMDNSIAAKNINASNDIVVNLRNTGTSDASGANNFIGASLAPLTLTQINAANVTDPQLGALPAVSTGGRADLMVPQPGSPVIDAQSCANAHSEDQRGVSRPQGSQCDVGAVEVRQNVTLGVNVYGTGAVNAVVPPMPASGGIVNCTSSGGAGCVAVYPNSEAQPFTANVTLNMPQGEHWSSSSMSGCVFQTPSLDGSNFVFTIPAHRCGLSLNLDTNTTTTTVTSSANPSIVGDPVTFTATVNPASPSTLLPSGTVTFYDGPSAICINAAITSAVPNTAQATCTLSNLAAGSHSISAQYHGDSNYPAANQPESAVLSQQIVKPTLTITANNQSKVYGQALTFAGTEFITSGLRNGDTVGSATLASTGAASAAGVAGSPYPITISNATGGTFNPSDYTINYVNGALTVNAAATTTAIAQPGAVSLGQSLTVNVSVTAQAPGTGTPIGTVKVSDGSASCTATLASGAGSCTLTPPAPAGSHTLNAAYVATADFAASSVTTSLTVSPAAASAVLSSSANPSLFGQTIALTATVTPSGSNPAPTGTVDFVDGAAAIANCSGISLTAGIARCTTSALSVGSHDLHANYAGDTNTAKSSAQLTQVVNAATTSMTLTASPNPAVVGHTVTLTATVVSTAPADARAPGPAAHGDVAGAVPIALPDATPTGTVTFYDGATQIGTGTLDASGTATLSLSSLAAGTHALSASYVSGGSFLQATAQVTLAESVPPVAAPMLSCWMLLLLATSLMCVGWWLGRQSLRFGDDE